MSNTKPVTLHIPEELDHFFKQDGERQNRPKSRQMIQVLQDYRDREEAKALKSHVGWTLQRILDNHDWKYDGDNVRLTEGPYDISIIKKELVGDPSVEEAEFCWEWQVASNLAGSGLLVRGIEPSPILAMNAAIDCMREQQQ